MRTATIVVMLVLLLTTVCMGGAWKPVKMALHVTTHISRTCTKNAPTVTSRDDLVRTWTVGGGDMDVFFYIFQYGRFQGTDFALMWPAEWGSAVFTPCSDLAIGSIIFPGDGISLAWQQCVNVEVKGPFVNCGWLWLGDPTSSGQIRIWDHPQHYDMHLYVGGCADSAETSNSLVQPDSVFYAAVDSIPYSGPPIYAVEATTWGSIKAVFK
jgi:hypothetical protein